MADQTTMNPPNAKRAAPPPAGEETQRIAHGASHLLHDIVTLAELQVKLTKLDAKEAVGRVVRPLVFLAAAGLVALFTFPLILSAMAVTLVEVAGWSWTAAAWTAVGTGLLLAGALFAIGRSKTASPADLFERSQTEFGNNLAWLKKTLRPTARS